MSEKHPKTCVDQPHTDGATVARHADAGRGELLRSGTERAPELSPLGEHPVDTSAIPSDRLPTQVSQPAVARVREASLARGRLVGRYVVVDKLGAGGMGVVYRAFDPDLDRSVALKLVKLDATDQAEDRSRLLREAQAMARLSHPNVIPVFDVGVEHDGVFVAMELVDGVTLGAWWREAKPNYRAVLAYLIAAGRGLSAAHRAGLIHRDFKPDNVMVGTDGRVRVLDFGLARGAATPSGESSNATAEIRAVSESRITGGRSLEASLTAAGAVMGTPAYMSPEQHLGRRVSAASDQFSFCVVLWEALYGERPFAGDTVAVLTANVMQGKLRDVPPGANVPAWVHTAVVRGLAVDDERRHADMDALLQALATDPRRRRRIALGIAGAGLAALGAGGWVGAQTAGPGTTHDVSALLCTGSADAMAGTWNDARRDALQGAFADTQLSYAPAVWANAANRLDGYATTWVAARMQACRATRITGEQSEARLDRRMLCLDGQRTALHALLDALAYPDDTAIEATIDAVRALPNAAACTDPPRPRDPSALPEDADARVAITAVRTLLAQVGAHYALGHYGQARAILAPALATVQLLDYPPLTATARAWQGEIEAQAGSPAQALQALQAAFTAATAADDVPAQAQLAGDLAFEFGYRAADPDRGRLWLSVARALVRRGGASPHQTAELDSKEGAMYVAAGKYTDAILAHERALAYWRALDPNSTSVARVLDDLGAAHVQLGEIDRAITEHRAAVAIRRNVYGEGHPVVAASERELGMALSKAGRQEEATGPLTRALAVYRQARGDNNTHVATVLDDLGRIERQRGNLDAALAYHNEALQIWEAALGDPHPDVAVSLLGVGYTLVAAERHAEAVVVQRRALAMFEASLSGEHPYVVYAANALGMALLASGDAAAAIAPLQRALSLRGKVQVDPTLFADTLYALGKAQWAVATTRAQREAAVAQAAQARDLFATQGERWTDQIADIEVWLARPQALGTQ